MGNGDTVSGHIELAYTRDSRRKGSGGGLPGTPGAGGDRIGILKGVAFILGYFHPRPQKDSVCSRKQEKPSHLDPPVSDH